MNNVHCPSMSCQRSGSADFQQNRQSDVNYQLEQPKMRLFVTTASYWSLKNGATKARNPAHSSMTTIWSWNAIYGDGGAFHLLPDQLVNA